MKRAGWMFRVALGFATISVVIAAMTACGTHASTAGLTIWYSTDDPVERGWSQDLAKSFMASHHGTHVTLTDYDFEDINQKLQLALSSGSPPDLAYVTPRVCGILTYVAHDKVMNLSGPARSNGWGRELRPGLLQDYNAPFSVYASQKPEQIGASHPIFAVPNAMAVVAMMYNARLLHRLHLSVPTTLAQFSTDLAAAKHAGITPIALGNADGWLGDDWYQTLVNTRVSYQDLERELALFPNFSFKRPTFESMARTLSGWAANGYFTSNFGGLDAQDGVDSFFKGNTLFEMVSSSENSQILSDQKQTKIPIGIFPFPNGSAGVMPQSGYEGWIVPKASGNKQLAIEFINWILKHQATDIVLKHGMLPATNVKPAAASDPWQKAYLSDIQRTRPGVYIDAAPVPNLNATMEANVQLLMAQIEGSKFLPGAMQQVYSSHGSQHGKIQEIDCEF